MAVTRGSFAWEEEWKLGRLAEDGDGEVLRALKGRMYRSVPVRGYAAPAHRSARPVAGDGRTVCYVRLESRRKGARGDRELALQQARGKHGGQREYVFPPRGEAKAARQAGAVWDRRVGAHYMRTGTAPAGWTSDAAERAWAARERGLRSRSGDGLAVAHLRYVERDGDETAEDLAADEQGVIVVSNVGGTSAERAAWWEWYEREVVRDGQVSHLRVVAELPHQLDAAGLRRTVSRMAEEFARRGLPHVGVVHRAPATGDARNVHVHWLMADRPGTTDGGADGGGTGPGGWRFAAVKDRDLRGPAFVAWLREVHTDACNGGIATAEREASPAAAAAAWRRWYPGTYADLGIERTSQLHLGPHDAALERAGIPTWRGVWNGSVEERYERVRAAAADLAAGRERAGVAAEVVHALAASLGGGPVEREAAWAVQAAGAVLDQDIDAHRRALDAQRAADAAWTRGERARRRAAWAEREMTRSLRRDPVRESVLRKAAAEAGRALAALGGDDHGAVVQARARAAATADRVAASRVLLGAAVEHQRCECLLGGYQRAEDRLRRLRRVAPTREALAAATGRAAALGLRVERFGWLSGETALEVIRAAAATAAPDLVAAAAGHLRAAGILAGTAATDQPAVRTVGEALRLERLLTRLEAERQRAKRHDPQAERARLEAAIRADEKALRLAVSRGLLAPSGAEGGVQASPLRGSVELD